jgi:hypothetical protein
MRNHVSQITCKSSYNFNEHFLMKSFTASEAEFMYFREDYFGKADILLIIYYAVVEVRLCLKYR